jgi:hypothetical protein
VLAVRHSAKYRYRWSPSRVGHCLPSVNFAEYRGTRQSNGLPSVLLCRVPDTRQSLLCRVLYFAECFFSGHSAKSQFPVVRCLLTDAAAPVLPPHARLARSCFAVARAGNARKPCFRLLKPTSVAIVFPFPLLRRAMSPTRQSNSSPSLRNTRHKC